jgi:tetratricopeptide (TPR) repeat protein
MSRNVFILLVFLCSSSQQVLYSQNDANTTPSDTATANRYFQQAEKFFEEAQYDSSIIYSEKANLIYEKEKVWGKYIQCLNTIGKNYCNKVQYDRALNYFNRSLTIGLEKCGDKSLEIAQTDHLYGIVYLSTGKYDTSLEYFQKALMIRLAVLGEKHPDVAGSYNNIGIVYGEKGDYDKALEYQQKALAITLAVLGEKHPKIAYYYNNIGIVYNSKGDYDKALEYQQKALAITLAVLGEKHPNIAHSYFNIGDIYNQKGDYDKALEYFQKALSLRLAALGENHPKVALGYLSIGLFYYNKGDYDHALDYYQKALSIQLKTLGEKHPDAAYSYNNIGCAYNKKGDYDKALEYHRKALSIQLEVLGEKHPDVAITYQNMGQVYFKQDNPAKALQYYQKSIVAFIQDFNKTNIYANPTLISINSDPNLLTSLELKAEALQKLYIEKSKNLKDLLCVVSTYELASNLIHKMKISYQSESSQLLLGEQAFKIYTKAISTVLHLYTLTHKDEYKEKAFTFSERSKASVLLQTLSESQAKQFAGIPSDLLEKERDLKIDLAFYEKNLFEEQSKGKKGVHSKITLWEDKLFNLKRESDALIKRFETDYPEYYDLKYKISIISPKEIQKKLLDKDDVLVEYFIGDSSIYIFTLTKQRLDVSTVKRDTLFEKQIKSMKEGLTKKNYALYTENAYRLYQTLIEPIKTTITNKNLIIIPDGISGYIPFETLLTQKADKNNKDYRQLAYLIKDNQITYDYSSTLLYENVTKGKNKSGSHYIGFAPVTFK